MSKTRSDSIRSLQPNNGDYSAVPGFGVSNNLLEAERYFNDNNPNMRYLNTKVYYGLFNKIQNIMKNINENNKFIEEFSDNAHTIIEEINGLIDDIFRYIDNLQSTLSSINLKPDDKDKIITEINNANNILVKLFNETPTVDTNELQNILDALKQIRDRLKSKVEELNVYTTNRQAGGRRYKGTKKRSSRRTKKSVGGKKRRSTRRHRKR